MPDQNATKTIDLYDDTMPFSLDEKIRPNVELFLASPRTNTGRTMLAFAGGAYRFLSKLSGVDFGAYFSKAGINVLVVNIRLGSQGYDGRAFCADALAAVRLAHRQADAWKIDTKKIGVIGTSAGGHLAGMLSTGAAEKLLENYQNIKSLPLTWRPEFAIFCYGVMSLEPGLRHLETAQHFLGEGYLDPRLQLAASPCRQISPDHCRSFLWHTAEDTEVSADNTLAMQNSLRRNGVPFESHLYQKGPHALGLAQENRGDIVLHWAEDAARWIIDDPVEPKIPVML